MLRKLAYSGLVILLVGANPLSSLPAAARAATTLYVNGSTGVDSPTCGAPSARCKTIGQAITNALAGDKIDVAAGTYAAALLVDKPLTITGAGQERTIVQGTTGHQDVVTVTADPVHLARVTVTGAIRAFGISNDPGARLTLADSTVRDNIGGGISNEGTLSITSSTIDKNDATRGASGGGISNSGKLSIADSSIDHNSATSLGGGIDNSGDVTLNHSTVTFNSSHSGAGISSSSGKVKLDHSSSDDNTATANGGALNISGGTAELDNSELLRNHAVTGGAIFSAAGVVVVLKKTTVRNNTAPQCVPASLC